MNKKTIIALSIVGIALVIFLALNLNTRVLKEGHIELKDQNDSNSHEYKEPPKVIAIDVISAGNIELNGTNYKLEQTESVIKELLSQDSRSPVIIRAGNNHNIELMAIIDMAREAGIEQNKITVARKSN